MSTETFKGARYIPKFYGNWTDEIGYEAIGVVKHNAFTYISKQPVPAGVQIDNTDFWLLWADPNAQMEELRQIFMQYVDTVEELSGVVGQWADELAAEIEARKLDIEKAHVFETVADMKNGDNLSVGAICHTNGFHTSGDGGAAWYVITDSGTANEMDVIACGDLFANLIIDNIINVKQLGAISDTSADEFEFFKRTSIIANEKNGCSIYIPAGTYLISKTLWIPSNTTLYGDGAKSKIKSYDRASALVGQGIVTAGSNIVIKNIMGSYGDETRGFNDPGNNVGSIAIGQRAFNGAYEWADNNLSEDYAPDFIDAHDIVIDTVYFDCTYAIQMETDYNGRGSLKNVIVNNIFAPIGVVSAQSNYSGTLDNIIFNNIHCVFFRIYQSFKANIIINNLFAHMANIKAGPISLNNAFIKMENNSPIKNWISAGIFTREQYLLNASCGTFSNIEVDCNNQSIFGGINFVNRLFSENNLNLPAQITNCIVKNCNSETYAPVKAIEYGQPYNRIYFNNCNFANNSSTATESINGQFRECLMPQTVLNSSFVNSDKIENRFSVEFESGISQTQSSFSTFCRRIGDLVFLRFDVTSENLLSRSNKIATIPSLARGTYNLAIPAKFALDSDTTKFYEGILNINTNGNVTIISAGIETSSIKRIVCDGVYDVNGQYNITIA